MYRKLAVVVGRLGSVRKTGMFSFRNGFVVRFSREHDRRRGECHTEVYELLESRRETLISVRVGPADRGSRGLAVHIFVAL